MNATLGAVVVAHDKLRFAIGCVRSLASEVPRQNRVVVVNDASSVAARELSELTQIATVVLCETRAGYGENANRGIARLPSTVTTVLISNDDVIFEPGGVTALASVLEHCPEAAVVGPAVQGADRQPQAAAFTFPSWSSELIAELILPKLLAHRLTGRHARVAEPGPRPVDWILGAAMMIRREHFSQVGGFDGRFVLYSEETDLCRRLRDRGWTTVSDGRVVVTHLGGASTGGGDRALLERSRSTYIARHWRPRDRIALAALRPAVCMWNHAYVGARIMFAPRQREAKLAMLRARRRDANLKAGKRVLETDDLDAE